MGPKVKVLYRTVHFRSLTPMQTIKSSCLEKRPRRLTLLLAVSLGLASGCAQIPRLDPPPSIRKVDELGSSSSFAVPAATWPSDHWWEVYGDPQLNALIDEALKNAPISTLPRHASRPPPRRFRARAPRACPRSRRPPWSPRPSRATTSWFRGRLFQMAGTVMRRYPQHVL